MTKNDIAQTKKDNKKSYECFLIDHEYKQQKAIEKRYMKNAKLTFKILEVKKYEKSKNK